MSKNGLSQTAFKRLINEERILKNDKDKDRLFVAVPREINGNPVYKTWDLLFLLRDSKSLYKDKVIEAEITFPEDYPLRPPSLTFLTKMFHPNIYVNGKVCISILEEDNPGPLGCGTPEDRWSPVQNIRTVALSLVILLDNPNPDSPANVDASKMFRDSREEYKEKVIKLIEIGSKNSMMKEKVNNILNK